MSQTVKIQGLIQKAAVMVILQDQENTGQKEALELFHTISFGIDSMHRFDWTLRPSDVLDEMIHAAGADGFISGTAN